MVSLPACHRADRDAEEADIAEDSAVLPFRIVDRSSQSAAAELIAAEAEGEEAVGDDDDSAGGPADGPDDDDTPDGGGSDGGEAGAHAAVSSHPVGSGFKITDHGVEDAEPSFKIVDRGVEEETPANEGETNTSAAAAGRTRTVPPPVRASRVRGAAKLAR